MNIPSDLLYTKEHEWIRIENGLATIGITDWAQEELGDIVYFEFSAVGDDVKQGQAFGTIEAVKAVSDINAPLSGKVEAVNDSLVDAPEIANQDPYGEGWMIKISMSNFDSEKENLLTPEAYKALLGQ